MSDLQTFGPVVIPTQVGSAIQITLQTWIQFYLDWISRQIGEPSGWLPAPQSYVITDEPDHWPEDQPPAVVIVVSGTDGQPKMSGDRLYRASWLAHVLTYVDAVDRATTDSLAKYYAAAIRSCLVQKGELGGLATGTQWRGETYGARSNERLKRTLGVSEVAICVDVRGVAQSFGGPLSSTGDPTQVPANLPEASTFPLHFTD